MPPAFLGKNSPGITECLLILLCVPFEPQFEKFL
jgi:hypothetical protein